MSIPACQPCLRFARPSRDLTKSRRADLAAGLLLWICLAFAPLLKAADAAWRIRHEPAQPRSGVVVKVTLEGATLPAAGAVLEYQDVAPGRYVAKADPEFAKSWRPVVLTRGTGGAWVAEIPAAVQVNRHLVRYRVRAAEGAAVLLPPKEDEQGNFAYFVYDGVPAWKGAVNPRGGGAAATVRTFTPESLTRVPVYHFLTTDRAVERVILGGKEIGMSTCIPGRWCTTAWCMTTWAFARGAEAGGTPWAKTCGSSISTPDIAWRPRTPMAGRIGPNGTN